MPDALECYELCVQSPRHVAAFLRAAHGNEPDHLREEFCGTAAVSRRWAGEGGRAVAIDFDEPTLARAAELAATSGVSPRIRFRHDDCIRPTQPTASDAADIIFVGNFSIGYIHTRTDLLEFLHRTRDILSRGLGGFGGGIFACDTYGGAGAFRLGGIQRQHPGRAGEVIHYTWVHEAADPATSMVRNSISFRVVKDGEVVQEWPRAFVYEWRLWSIVELREAMLEAGFTGVEVYKDVNVAPGERPRPAVDSSDYGDDWIVMLVARA